MSARVPAQPDPAAEARELAAAAFELAEQNEQLRRALVSVLVWIADRRELLELARQAIDRRFPEERPA